MPEEKHRPIQWREYQLKPALVEQGESLDAVMEVFGRWKFLHAHWLDFM